jgi:hypothetical protein
MGYKTIPFNRFIVACFFFWNAYLTGNRKMTNQNHKEMRKAMKNKVLRTIFLFDCWLAGEPTNRRLAGCRHGDPHA